MVGQGRMKEEREKEGGAERGKRNRERGKRHRERGGGAGGEGQRR